MKRHNLGSGRGLTLIEVIVSVALLAILSLMLVTFITTALASGSMTGRRTGRDVSAAGEIESHSAASAPGNGSPTSLTITFGTSSYPVHGYYDSDSSGIYTSFVPDNSNGR